MPNLPDEKNPEMCLQALDTSILIAAARGEIDLNALARKELASRGISPRTGAWVGFAKAAQELADEEGAQ